MTTLLSLRGAKRRRNPCGIRFTLRRAVIPHRLPKPGRLEHRRHGSPRPPSRRARDDNTVCHYEERTRRSNPCGRRQTLPVHIDVVTAFYFVSRFARLARPGNIADA